MKEFAKFRIENPKPPPPAGLSEAGLPERPDLPSRRSGLLQLEAPIIVLGHLVAFLAVGGRAAGVHTALVDPFDDWDGVDCPRFKDLEALSRAFRANVAP